ncbi:acylphosphatase [Propionibacterium sp. oral taxon 192]|uniref:acylphosphatase n=1 Tax=Propionibacterium sp. oral taxon 192 TaxID=671222 RepID=UPI001E3E4DC8|nr:acylphosphatase [Propionibacterium sp. oral taxon 192]
MASVCHRNYPIGPGNADNGWIGVRQREGWIMGEVRGVRVLVGGRVQGVGFRWSTLHRAEALGLTGWVRNLPDGHVEVLAHGEAAVIDAFVEWLREGPRWAQVRELRVYAVPHDPGLIGFTVR